MGLFRRKRIKHILVLSGKGGTGKSTISLNLALKLKDKGFKVGIMDCDITTPNIHKMLGLPLVELDTIGEPPNDKIIPMDVDGLKLISIAMNIDDAQGILMEQDMLKDHVDTLLNQVEWGDLDYIVIDMPPGTSTEFITVAEIVPKDSVAVIVMIPGETSKMDASRALSLMKHREMKIAGIVENMAYVKCSHCGDLIYDGIKMNLGKSLAKQFNINYLGNLPLNFNVPQEIATGRNSLKDTKDFMILFEQIFKVVK